MPGLPGDRGERGADGLPGQKGIIGDVKNFLIHQTNFYHNPILKSIYFIDWYAWNARSHWISWYAWLARIER